MAIGQENMILYGFTNLYCVWPAFLYPIFTNGTGYFFEDGKGKYIERFCEFTIDRLPTSYIYPLGGVNEQFHIGSPTIYAFQESSESQTFWGDSGTFLPFLLRYYSTLQQNASDNQPLLTEVNNIIWDILLKNGAIRKISPSARIKSAYHREIKPVPNVVRTPPSLFLIEPSECTIHMDFGEKTSNILDTYCSYCSPYIRRVQRKYKLPFRSTKLQIKPIVEEIMFSSMRSICDLFVCVLRANHPFDTENLVFSINRIVKSEAVNQAYIYAEKERLALLAPATTSGFSKGADKIEENDEGTS